jgi:excisionase family DNA binding protein
MRNPQLPPDVFEAIVNFVADTMVTAYRAKWNAASPAAQELPPAPQQPIPQVPWLTTREAAERANCSAHTIYAEVNAGRLRAARIGGKRLVRIKAEWVDEWLSAESNRSLRPK